MGFDQPLPLPSEFSEVDTYIGSLLKFGTESYMLRTLCGGVHILDFFTQEPDLYSLILPENWRQWFKSVELDDMLHLLMREDLESIAAQPHYHEQQRWRGKDLPPATLVDYIRDVRRHCLGRELRAQGPRDDSEKLSRKVSAGMKPKKLHEVDYFARWINRFTKSLANERDVGITHFVDFGSGQNFLGRALASAPYNKSVIAVESRPHVVQMAKRKDIRAGVIEKPQMVTNKKQFRAAVAAGESLPADKLAKSSKNPYFTTNNGYTIRTNDYVKTIRATLELPQDGKGSIQYVEHSIKDGDLSAVVEQIVDSTGTSYQNASEDGGTVFERITAPAKPALMVMSLHSCGNLSHHGLRSLVMNPSVQAVAIIGCCYNLLTERLGPPTYKIPALRAQPRLEATSNVGDSHGFPMSERFYSYKHPPRQLLRKTADSTTNGAAGGKDAAGSIYHDERGLETGIRLNITSRMMAVQAPYNWGRAEDSDFFTRHFYRALLQRILLDKGIVSPPTPARADAVDGEDPLPPSTGGVSPAGTGVMAGTDPIVIGTLGKTCYRDFVAYVRGAVAKIASNSSGTASAEAVAAMVEQRLGGMTDDEIKGYQDRFADRKKDLCVVWSLMAFSAGVVESLIVVDRWCWLVEQECVAEAWVEPVFDYGLSPRNLVVVGVKKTESTWHKAEGVLR